MRARRSTCAWVVAGLLVPGVVSAQGIADVAKREKGRLDQAKQQPGTTYTNDSFGGAASAPKAQKPGGETAKPPTEGTKPPADAAQGASAAGAPTAAPAPAAAPAAATASPAAATAPAAAPATAVTSAPSPTSPATAPATSAAPPAESEAYWRSRAQAAQKAVDDAKARLAVLKAAGGADQAAAIEKAQRQLDSARDAQEALLAKARRAGAHADWLR